MMHEQDVNGLSAILPFEIDAIDKSAVNGRCLVEHLLQSVEILGATRRTWRHPQLSYPIFP